MDALGTSNGCTKVPLEPNDDLCLVCINFSSIRWQTAIKYFLCMRIYKDLRNATLNEKKSCNNV